VADHLPTPGDARNRFRIDRLLTTLCWAPFLAVALVIFLDAFATGWDIPQAASWLPRILLLPVASLCNLPVTCPLSVRCVSCCDGSVEERPAVPGLQQDRERIVAGENPYACPKLSRSLHDRPMQSIASIAVRVNNLHNLTEHEHWSRQISEELRWVGGRTHQQIREMSSCSGGGQWTDVRSTVALDGTS
jgi:hypothetical protein